MGSIERWLDAKRVEGRSERTLTYYRSTAEELALYLGRDPMDATAAEIRSYLAMKGRTCSNVTVNNHRRNLNSYYRFLEDEDEIAKSPMRRIHYVKEERTVKEPFSDEESERIRAACGTPRETAVIAFLASTGCRVGELVGVLRSDTDIKEREALVLGKGGKERVVYFDAACGLALSDYLAGRDDDCPYLFVGRHGRQLTVGGVERMVREVGRRAGVPNVHPHRFRRTVATRAIEHGMPIEQVKELLGHSQVQTTMIYAKVSRESVKAAHRRYLS